MPLNRFFFFRSLFEARAAADRAARDLQRAGAQLNRASNTSSRMKLENPDFIGGTSSKTPTE